ncbi:unnamed protein product [Oikopleura dioica]|uniref:PDZ domain-containing protein n=1 Tax=Oikopleura dioica TaxID=34765 RepID=E4XGG5_OIKDI|nr:unnamed protein product [Oikopleura dioica]
MVDLPPPPGLNVDLEEAAKNLTKMGQKLSGSQEKQEDRALETKEMKLLRDLLHVENELDEKINQVKDLVDREKNIKERDHQPLGKLLSVLDSAKTAIATDYYLLFTKAHLKYRPRTIKIEAASSESFGFRVQQTRVGGKRIFYFSSVTDRSPSAKAGLCQGDRLVELNDKTVDEYDYDELIEKIQTASKPNDEGKKVLIFLLSDPETDEYIQTELALPVIRYQVKPHVNPDSIAKEWLKFRKKQKIAKKGFFSDTSHFETKLELIKPKTKSKPPVSEAQPAMVQEHSDKFISPLPTPTSSTHSGQSRENEIDDVPALNYDRGGERRLLSRIITDNRARGPPRREGWADEPSLRDPSPAHGWNDQSFPPNDFHNNERPVFDNSSNQSHHQQGWANGQRSRHRSSDQWNHPSRFPADEPPTRWNGLPHHHQHHTNSGPLEHTRDFDSRHSHIPPEDYNRHWSHGNNHEANHHGQHVGMRPDSWIDDRRRQSHPDSRFRPY